MGNRGVRYFAVSKRNTFHEAGASLSVILPPSTFAPFNAFGLMRSGCALLLTVADRVVILVKAQIVFEGAPAALKADPAVMQQHLGV